MMKSTAIPRKTPVMPTSAKATGQGAMSTAKRAFYDQEEYDRVLLAFLNRESDGNANRKKWIVKDLEHLNQDQFFDIISRILSGAPDSLKNTLRAGRGNCGLLTEFNALHKGFRVTNNVANKRAYASLQRLFLGEPNLLIPATVVNPSGDPVRTKRVLRYLVAMEVKSSTNWQGFGEILDYKLDAMEQRRGLTEELNKVVEQINARTCQLFDWEQEVGSLRKQSQEKAEEIAKLGEKINRLEYEAEADKDVYLENERDLQRIRNQVANVKSQTEENEKRVVNDINKIKDNHDREKQTLDSLQNKREDCNAEISRLTERRNLVSNIGENIRRVSSFLAELVEIMQDVGATQSEVSANEEDANLLIHEKQELCSQIEELRSMKPAVQGLPETEVNKTIKEVENVRTNLLLLEQSLKNISENMASLNIESQRQLAEWEQNNLIIHDLTAEISNNREVIETQLPEQRKKLITIMELMVQSLEDDIALYVASAHNITKRQ